MERTVSRWGFAPGARRPAPGRSLRYNWPPARVFQAVAEGRTVTQPGTLYRTGPWVLGAKGHSTSIGLGRDAVYSFDLEGRPLFWFERGRTYKRSLASEVHARDRDGGRRRLWRLSAGEAADRFEAVLAVARRAPYRQGGEALGERFERILAWSPERLLGERDRFESVYRPLSILPPDQYLAVVLQATFGCSWNRCTFCNFYQGEAFRARSAASFETHCRGVRDLLGDGAGLRRSLFLATGNALVLANERLRPLFRTATAWFPGRPIAGFVDVFSGARKSVEDWIELREAGLGRVHVGLETGHDPLLDWLHKPGRAHESESFVRTLKQAGLRVSVIVMAGVGGARFAADHTRDTSALVARLPLTRGDTIYLSPFVEHGDSVYAERAAAAGIRALDSAELDAHHAALRDAFRGAHAQVTVARYDIREFVY